MRAWFSTHIIVGYLSIAIIVRVSYLLEIKSRCLSGASGIAVLPLQPIFSHFVQSPAVVALAVGVALRCASQCIPFRVGLGAIVVQVVDLSIHPSVNTPIVTMKF